VKRRRSTSGVAITGAAAAALVLGHWAAYVLAYRQIRLRDAVLAQSGHSYLAPLGKLVFVLVFLCLANVLVEAVCERDASRNPPASLGSMVIRMTAIQVVGFSALEVVERLVARAPVIEMFGHYTYVLGVAMQAVTALVAALVIWLLARTAQGIRRLLSVNGSRHHSAHVLQRATSMFQVPLRRGLLSASGVRGPPRLLHLNASAAGGAN
jgi:hypothetical protein